MAINKTKTTKKVSSKGVSTPVKTTTVKTKTESSQASTPSIVSQSNPFAKDSKMRSFHFDKRVSLPIIGLIILLGLGFLANKYLVVAWVDMKPITRFEYYNDLSKRYGKDEMDQLVVQKLIESEADKKGVSASDAEIKTQISQIETQQGGATQLDQVLQMQNLTRSDLHDLVKLQILRQKLFGAGLSVSDDEIKQYEDQNKASLPEIKTGDASGEAQLQDNVRQQLLQQKISATFSAWVQTNTNSSRVVKLQP